MCVWQSRATEYWQPACSQYNVQNIYVYYYNNIDPNTATVINKQKKRIKSAPRTASCACGPVPWTCFRTHTHSMRARKRREQKQNKPIILSHAVKLKYRLEKKPHIYPKVARAYATIVCVVLWLKPKALHDTNKKSENNNNNHNMRYDTLMIIHYPIECFSRFSSFFFLFHFVIRFGCRRMIFFFHISCVCRTLALCVCIMCRLPIWLVNHSNVYAEWTTECQIHAHTILLPQPQLEKSLSEKMLFFIATIFRALLLLPLFSFSLFLTFFSFAFCCV